MELPPSPSASAVGSAEPALRELLLGCYSALVRVLAYLDPGTGSMLVQLLVGGVAAVGVAAKLYWRRLLSLLRIRRAPAEPDQEH